MNEVIKPVSHRGTSFRITPENVVAWKGKSGAPSRGVLVDGKGSFYLPNGRPARTETLPNGLVVSLSAESLDRQWTKAEKSARQKFTEESRAIARGTKAVRS